jgi:hypothetical protein
MESVVSRNHYHNARGTTFIVVGGAGCDEMQYKINADSSAVEAVHADTYPHPRVPFDSELRNVFVDAMASGLLTVVNRSALLWQLHNSHSGEVMDSLLLTRD